MITKSKKIMWNKMVELQALIGEGQALDAIKKGMMWENEQRKVQNESMAYTEKDFNKNATDTLNIVKEMRALKF